LAVSFAGLEAVALNVVENSHVTGAAKSANALVVLRAAVRPRAVTRAGAPSAPMTAAREGTSGIPHPGVELVGGQRGSVR
jgi:hypothetical protein